MLYLGDSEIMWNNINPYQFFNLRNDTNLSAFSCQLSKLSIWSMQFDEPPNDILSVVPLLTTLIIASSGLRVFPDFSKTPAIVLLDFRRNKIQKLSVSDVEKLNHLKMLILVENGFHRWGIILLQIISLFPKRAFSNTVRNLFKKRIILCIKECDHRSFWKKKVAHLCCSWFSSLLYICCR